MIEALIIIIEILGMACLGHMAVDFLQSLDKPFFDRKPFNCEMCLTFWLSVGYFIADYGLFGVPVAALTGVVADLIYRLKERL